MRDAPAPVERLPDEKTEGKVDGKPMFDCQSCGACCSGWDVDVAPGDPVPTALVKEDPVIGLPIMRVRKGRCIALRGQIGGSVSCSIYKNRPTVCRQFQPGSPDCLRSRARSGLPPTPV